MILAAVAAINEFIATTHTIIGLRRSAARSPLRSLNFIIATQRVSLGVLQFLGPHCFCRTTTSGDGANNNKPQRLKLSCSNGHPRCSPSQNYEATIRSDRSIDRPLDHPLSLDRSFHIPNFNFNSPKEFFFVFFFFFACNLSRSLLATKSHKDKSSIVNRLTIFPMPSLRCFVN